MLDVDVVLMYVLDGKLEAYFRGRKLKGKEVGIPEGYMGGIFCKDDGGKGEGEGIRERGGGDGGERGEEEEGEGEGEGEEMEEVASFDKLVLWGHESLVEGDDVFVKGVEEWIGFAEAVSPAYLQLWERKQMLMGWL